MAIEMPEPTRASAFFRSLDAKDERALRAAFADDAQGVDELTRGWMRGRAALEAYFSDALPRLSEIHSTLEQAEERRWGDVEVETFEAPTTVIWRREDDAWKIALFHSIPLPPAS